MKRLEDLRVCIVHDWLIGGGAELVVLELHKMFPEAPIYSSYATDEWRQKLDNKVITGYLQHWPFSKLRKFIPFLRARWFSHLDLSEYDLVISSSGAEAKGIHVRAGTVHINYCHAPTHYYWLRYDEYMQRPGFGLFDPLARLGLKLFVGPLRKWDRAAAQRPNYMIANSTFTKSQIQKYYGRESVVIHPPVDVERFTPNLKSQISNLKRGFVIAGRQTPYKRFDLAVAACSKLGLPLSVIGTGPDYNKLVKTAGPTVKFLGFVPSEQIPVHFQSAAAFIFPGLDDFGITPVEALAAGTPVIAYKDGGALDYVNPGKTGEFFDAQTVESLCDALSVFNTDTYDEEALFAKAKQFTSGQFHDKVYRLIKEIVL